MNNIEYPKKNSEAEIQSLVWYFLRKRKVDARLQVTALSNKCHKRSNKLDMVVFDKQKHPVCIVEFKSWMPSYIRNHLYRKSQNTKQLDKYKVTYGLPVLVCGVMSDATKTVANVLALLH